jgi:hypothetical protein
MKVMPNVYVSDGGTVDTVEQKLLDEESNRLVAVALWETDLAESAAAKKANKPKKATRRHGRKLLLSDNKTKRLRRPSDSVLTQLQWKGAVDLAKQVMSESRSARRFKHRLKRKLFSCTPFLPFVVRRLEAEAIELARDLGAVWRRFRQPPLRQLPMRAHIRIEQRGIENVLHQLRVNAGFYGDDYCELEEGLDEMFDSDEEDVDEDEEVVEEGAVGRIVPTVWGQSLVCLDDMF